MRLMILLTMILFSVAAFPQPDKKFVRQGNNDYKEGSYQQAEVEYRKALEENPASYKADFNLGNALYKQKQYDAAAAKYAGLAEKESERQKLGRYYYNLGNALYEKKSYQESIEAYKNALRNVPADMDAKHNLQMALSMLNEQQQQQQQQQQNKNDQQQNKDQQRQQGDENQQKQDQQDQNQPKEQKGQESQDGSQPQQVKGQISPEDAERILQALENEEKDVMKRVQEKKERTQKLQSDKNW